MHGRARTTKNTTKKTTKKRQTAQSRSRQLQDGRKRSRRRTTATIARKPKSPKTSGHAPGVVGERSLEPRSAGPGSGRGPTATLRRQDAFLKNFVVCGTVKHAAQAAQINRDTHYEWLRTDPGYAERFLVAQEDALDELEQALRHRALERSDRLLEFLVRTRRAELERRRSQLQFHDKLAGRIDQEKLKAESDESVAQVVAFFERVAPDPKP